MQKQKESQADAPDVREPSFQLAWDGLESNYLLLNGGLVSGFKWLFITCTLMVRHITYFLHCLCSSPCEPETERAWMLVEGVFPRGISSAGTHDEYGTTAFGDVSRCSNVKLYLVISGCLDARYSIFLGIWMRSSMAALTTMTRRVYDRRVGFPVTRPPSRAHSRKSARRG